MCLKSCKKVQRIQKQAGLILKATRQPPHPTPLPASFYSSIYSSFRMSTCSKVDSPWKRTHLFSIEGQHFHPALTHMLNAFPQTSSGALALYDLTRVTGTYFIAWDGVTNPKRPPETLKYESRVKLERTGTAICGRQRCGSRPPRAGGAWRTNNAANRKHENVEQVSRLSQIHHKTNEQGQLCLGALVGNLKRRLYKDQRAVASKNQLGLQPTIILISD